MEIKRDNEVINKSLFVNSLLWVPAGVPLILIFCSFFSGVWSWGIMDDIWHVVNPWTNCWQKAISLTQTWMGSGIFRPIYAFHTAIFYKLFANHAWGFYIFRWLETSSVLVIWGILSYLITKKLTAIPLVVAISLSFYKLYDAYYFLSTAEIVGLFFAGIAGIGFFKAFESSFSESNDKISLKHFLAGSLFALLSFGCKEVFFIFGIALGISVTIMALLNKKKKILFFGLLILLVSLSYGIWLKFFLKGSYSGRYSLTNTAGIVENVFTWIHHDLKSHLPWLLIAIPLLFYRVKFNLSRWLWLLFGALFYFGYTFVLLPWNTWGHYATPLSVMFAFWMSILIAERVEKISPIFLSGIVILSLVINIFTASAAIDFFSTYQKDTANLVRWVADNVLFEHEVKYGANVRSNAEEPGSKIPLAVRYYYHKTYKPFIFTPRVRDIVADKKTRYYLYGPKWGDQDLRRLGGMWDPVFLSDHWIMFRRLF